MKTLIIVSIVLILLLWSTSVW